MPTPDPITATINNRSLELTLGDITQQEVDAIVNAANSRLAGGGGVDGAIHRAGGPSIMAETERRYPDGCPTGSAVITSAGNLRTKYVIHAVGPVWSGGNRGEAALLASAYNTSLELAASHNCRSIALPALSTGAYHYPIDSAARIAIGAAAKFLRELREGQSPALMRFVLFSADMLAAFKHALLQEAAAK
jgi:O-acetyl-ADP-ribose deacetylase